MFDQHDTFRLVFNENDTLFSQSSQNMTTNSILYIDCTRFLKEIVLKLKSCRTSCVVSNGLQSNEQPVITLGLIGKTMCQSR